LSVDVEVRPTGAKLPLTGNAKRKAQSAPKFYLQILIVNLQFEACSD
jgi:hypothetical protein